MFAAQTQENLQQLFIVGSDCRMAFPAGLRAGQFEVSEVKFFFISCKATPSTVVVLCGPLLHLLDLLIGNFRVRLLSFMCLYGSSLAVTNE